MKMWRHGVRMEIYYSKWKMPGVPSLSPSSWKIAEILRVGLGQFLAGGWVMREGKGRAREPEIRNKHERRFRTVNRDDYSRRRFETSGAINFVAACGAPLFAARDKTNINEAVRVNYDYTRDGSPSPISFARACGQGKRIILSACSLGSRVFGSTWAPWVVSVSWGRLRGPSRLLV